MLFRELKEVTPPQGRSQELKRAIDVLNQAGLDFLLKGKPKDALEKFLEILAKDPDHLYVPMGAISYQCAQAHYELKKYGLALESIDAAIKAKPREATYREAKAIILSAQLRANPQQPITQIGQTALVALMAYDLAIFLSGTAPHKSVAAARRDLIQWTEKQFKAAGSNSFVQYRLTQLDPRAKQLSLHDCLFDAHTIEMLCTILVSNQYPCLTTLHLTDTLFKDEWLLLLIKSLAKNYTLTDIVWQGAGTVPDEKNAAKAAHKKEIDALLYRNQLYQKKQLGQDDLRRLDFATLKPQDMRPVLTHHATTLTELYFEKMDRLHQTTPLVQLITLPEQYTRLTLLTLCGTQLMDDHIQQLHTTTAENRRLLFPALVVMDLRDNQIANVGFTLLLDLLHESKLPSLTHLLLQDNHITQDLSLAFEATTLPQGEPVTAIYLSGNFLKPDLTPTQEDAEDPEKNPSEVEMARLAQAHLSTPLLAPQAQSRPTVTVEKKYRPERETDPSSEEESESEEGVSLFSQSDPSTAPASENRSLASLLIGLHELPPTEQLARIATYQEGLVKQVECKTRTGCRPLEAKPAPQNTALSPTPSRRPAVFAFLPDEMATGGKYRPVVLSESKAHIYALTNHAQDLGLGHFRTRTHFFQLKSSPAPKESALNPSKQITQTEWVVRLARTTGWSQSAFVLFEGMDDLGQRFLRRAYLGRAENGRAPVQLEQDLQKILNNLGQYYLSETYAYVIKSPLVTKLLTQINRQVKSGVPYIWHGGCAPCGQDQETQIQRDRPLNCMLWCRSLLATLKVDPLPSSWSRAPCCAMPPKCG